MKLAILFLTSIGLFAQAITTSSLTLTAPAPPPVKSLSTSIVGNAGNATYYYWVVAKYTGGNSVLSPSAIVINAPNTLSVGNYVRIDWNIQVGANTYDVLRTTTPNVPNGDCNCAIALAQAGTTFSDQGGALSAYTITSAGGASTTCIINNLTVASPTVSCSPISWGGGGSAVTAGYGIDIVGDEISVNTAIIPDWPGIQSGVANYCRSTTGSSTMTCALATTLTVYTSGSCFVLSSNFANVTTATLDIDALGAKSVLNRSGGALSAGEIPADKPVTVCYDGTNFILQGGTITGPLSTTGAIPYVTSAGVLGQDPTALFWDNTNKRLGVGTNAPLAPVYISASGGGANNGLWLFRSATGTGMQLFNSSGWVINTTDVGDPLKLFVGGVEGARVAATTRNLLIGGTTDGNYKLDVQSSGTSGTARFYDQGGAGSTLAVIQAGAAQSGNLLSVRNNAGTEIYGFGATYAGFGNASIYQAGSTGIKTGYVSSFFGDGNLASSGASSPVFAMMTASSYMGARSNAQYGWTASATDASAALDSGLKRASANHVAVTDGSSGLGKIVVSQATPAASSDACTAGGIWADATYIYGCTASGAIKRIAWVAF